MSKAVEGVTEKIEECARKEFKSRGYVDASLRTIAMEAGTTTGSIYSRYGGKEGLFSALVEPAAREFTEIFEDIQKKFHAMESDMQTESLDEYSRNGMIQLVEYMYDHFEEFNLLVDIETDYTYKYMEAVGLKFKEGRPLTKDFMHIMNTALFESFFEVIRHNMSKEEAMEYIDLLEKYHSAGWSVIYNDCK